MTGDTYPAADTGSDAGVTLQRPIIVSALYLLGMMNGVTVLIGLILAYVWRGEDGPEWENTHFTYLIRTFWIVFWGTIALVVGLLVVAVIAAATQAGADPDAINPVSDDPPAGVMLAVVIAAFAGVLLFVWSCVRSIISLAKAASRRPMPRPRTFLF